ncbi:MAG: ACT domain-containing protein [Candidatus Omnitrophica bacterium]|nr:ACT domain-containing protein [Candidatus Omnitrophota bacterium]
MARRWIVTALGKDRPGIVAGVTGLLYKLGCNLEDSAMTRLEGEFAIMLIFSTPQRATAASLAQAFAPLQRRLKLVIHLKPLTKPESKTPKPRGRRHTISVYGADRPGIVFRIASFLARRKVNITDVHTHRSAGRGPSLYSLLLELELPRSRSADALEAQLERIAQRLGVHVSLTSAEPDVL